MQLIFVTIFGFTLRRKKIFFFFPITYHPLLATKACYVIVDISANQQICTIFHCIYFWKKVNQLYRQASKLLHTAVQKDLMVSRTLSTTRIVELKI